MSDYDKVSDKEAGQLAKQIVPRIVNLAGGPGHVVKAGLSFVPDEVAGKVAKGMAEASSERNSGAFLEKLFGNKKQ